MDAEILQNYCTQWNPKKYITIQVRWKKYSKYTIIPDNQVREVWQY